MPKIPLELANSPFSILCAVAAAILIALISREGWRLLRRFRVRVQQTFWQSLLKKGLWVQGLEPMIYVRNTSPARIAMHLSTCNACVNRDRCHSAWQAGQRRELLDCPLHRMVGRYQRRHQHGGAAPAGGRMRQAAVRAPTPQRVGDVRAAER